MLYKIQHTPYNTTPLATIIRTTKDLRLRTTKGHAIKPNDTIYKKG